MRTVLTAARPARRAGVTLIELLVVVAIIGVMASLAISGVMTLRSAQLKRFTETTIEKLASALDQQMKATLDQIKQEPPNGWALAMANGDLRRAKVIYAKARLKQEFPVSFYQALYPYANTSMAPGAIGQPASFPGGVLTANDLPAKSTYSRALAGVAANYRPPPATNVPLPQKWESSALLYLALAQGRRGMAAFKPDELVEPTAIQTVGGFKVFVDSWGEPLRLFLFPVYNTELNDPSLGYYKPAAMASPDPQDPEGTTAAPTWTTTTQKAFQFFLHPLNVSGRSGPFHLIPVIASSGPDMDFGLVSATGDPAELVAWMSLGGDRANDNIYSYRLRKSGARGD
jgi:prepilin-type N-terminal cleavage/methylation domain-containing protein